MTLKAEDQRRKRARAAVERRWGRDVVVNTYSGVILAADVQEWRRLTRLPGHCTECGSVLRFAPHHPDCPRRTRGAAL